MATGAAASTGGSFRKRFLKTGLVVLCSATIGGTFTAESMRRKIENNSLTVNLMNLPVSHREILTSFQNMEDAQLTPNTYLSSAESLLPHVRKLKANIGTHHMLRIQAASFLKKYHNELQTVLAEKGAQNKLDLEEYLIHLRRRMSDMQFAFDLVDFKASDVSQNIKDIVRFNKMDYARLARDPAKIRKAFDEIYGANLSHYDVDTESQAQDNDAEAESEEEAEMKRRQQRETKENLMEHELMALYTHAPYLGEWRVFMKIADALYDNYGKLEAVNSGNELDGHKDGINFSDLYYIGREADIAEAIPVPMTSSLKFDVKPIEYIKIRYKSFKSVGDDSGGKDSNQQNAGGWFGASSSSGNHGDVSPSFSGWMELNNDNYNDNVVPMNVCRLGGVQKTLSISKCVPRVQGPRFHDHRMKMRGSAVFLAPRKQQHTGNEIRVIPNNVELNGLNDFVPIRQIEEWDLKPTEEGNINELTGTIKVRREPVNAEDACDSFEVEYDCILKLSGKQENYY